MACTLDYENVDLSYLSCAGQFEKRNLECVTTGRMFNNPQDACHAYGLSYYRMLRHLRGEVPSLKRLVFKYGPTWDELPPRV